MRQYLVAPATDGPLLEAAAPLEIVGVSLGTEIIPCFDSAYWTRRERGPAMRVSADTPELAIARVRDILRAVR